EGEDLDALVARDLQRDRAGDRAGGELELRRPRAGHHVDVHRDHAGGAEVGLRDVQGLDVGGVHAARDVVQAAVEQVEPRERGGVADAGDALDRRVDLELVGGDFVGREGAGVGGLDDQALDVEQQRRDFAQSAFGGGDDV